MAKNSKFKELKTLIEEKNDPRLLKAWEVLSPFFLAYEQIIEQKQLDLNYYHNLLKQFCLLVIEQINHPCKFASYHKAVRSPIDYHKFGNEIFRPLIDIHASTLKGEENIQEIETLLARGENAILFANHQIEADPQALNLLLESKFPNLGEKIIYVAGARVLTDPAAVPFSLGCNLFCIYSKRYFTAHEAEATAMRAHNQRTLAEILAQLNLGGKCIYIAPSGGRDRKGTSGKIEISPFDPQSVELMYLMGKKSKRPTHFYPLALSTHDILPPPETIQVNLGEVRSTKEAPIHAHFGKKIDMENFTQSDTTEKAKKKQARTSYIYHLICEMYENFPVFK